MHRLILCFVGGSFLVACAPGAVPLAFDVDTGADVDTESESVSEGSDVDTESETDTDVDTDTDTDVDTDTDTDTESETEPPPEGIRDVSPNAHTFVAVGALDARYSTVYGRASGVTVVCDLDLVTPSFDGGAGVVDGGTVTFLLAEDADVRIGAGNAVQAICTVADAQGHTFDVTIDVVAD